MPMIRFAVDLGTTTIDTCLFDREKGQVLAKKSMKNRQSLYGSDVINRISAGIKNPEHIKVMKEMVLSDLEEALVFMLRECNQQADAVSDIVICGNTTMISILMEYDLSTLGHAPFTPPFRTDIKVLANDLFAMELPKNCEVILSGCASAFIGGDILAGLSYLEDEHAAFFDKNHRTLFLDLGTNGEMVFCNQGKYSAVSAACGPAFEGCTRRQGVHGSGAIDAIAMGISTKKISREGVIAEPFFEKGIRIMNVHLDMEILRQILLAKAAIRSGIQFLLDSENVCANQLDRIFLAGGFGFYLNIENAIKIGLFPKDIQDKIVVVGNTSLMGACYMSREKLPSVYTEEDKIHIIQLAGNPDYQEALINNMYFEEN